MIIYHKIFEFILKAIKFQSSIDLCNKTIVWGVSCIHNIKSKTKIKTDKNRNVFDRMNLI